MFNTDSHSNNNRITIGEFPQTRAQSNSICLQPNMAPKPEGGERSLEAIASARDSEEGKDEEEGGRKQREQMPQHLLQH
ncbi:MAG: hypothetical protein M1561_02825 [Gammaproteobacteria bacterium]|nr:hypothetical protein [Gammaproteobacteria bacterium]